MTRRVRWQFAIGAALICTTATTGQAKPAKPALAQGEPLSQERLNWLVERDRPRDTVPDFSGGKPWSPDASRKLVKWIDRQRPLGEKAVAEYRQKPTVKAWRKMLDLTYSGGGLRGDELIGGGMLQRTFRALHEVGPPLDDPENGGDAAFTAQRHRAMMRLLARYLWEWHWVSDTDQRMAAGYLADCERRPSTLRPTGNNHDPNCGLIFEMDYVHDNRKVQAAHLYMSGADPINFWDVDSIPQAFSDFAARVPSSRPMPKVHIFFEYPLVLDRPQRTPFEPWAGNEYGLIVMYNRPYVASRAYQEERYIAAKKATLEEYDRLAKRSEEERRARKEQEREAGERWDELWAQSSLSSDLQLELENIADSLNRLDLYRTRYQIISYYRIAGYCQMGYRNECFRKFRMDDDARMQQQAAALGGGGGGGSSSGGSQIVTVRTYDQNGNYTGSTATTRIDAILSGARPK
jgi:hypothetical protein